MSFAGQPQPGQPAQQPGMQQHPPQGGTGAATMQRPMMGAAAQGMAAVHTALEMLQKALPGLPMGSELHTAVLKAVTDLSRRMQNGQQGGGDHSAQVQMLAQQARGAQQDPMAAAMQRMQQQPQPPAPPEQGQ